MYSVQPVSKRGLFVSFDDLAVEKGDPTTNIFIIQTDCKGFILDTYLGPAAIKPVLDRFIQLDKPKIIINSHHHWDHVWGNCAFPESIVIAHRLCRERMAQDGTNVLAQKRMYAMGEVSIALPTLTFEALLYFPEDGIRLFHSPGHTADSISVLDEMDNALFVGDNVELPVPFCRNRPTSRPTGTPS